MDEKVRVAAGSVAVALFLTAFKLGVGLMTGSLGILSEAAHSGLDLLAALMTWFAVSVSGKPADPDHPYGHQKIENLSALFETLLLVVTCVWIVYEAVHRLFFKSVVVEVNAWSYLVMATAIVLDFTRSRLLYRVARKTHSAALEADALHFSSDIGSSAVVLVGLVFTQFGYPQADPIAALGVSIFVLFICVRLGLRAVDRLVDKVEPHHLERAAAAAASVPGVLRVYDVRVREAGNQHFVDLKVAVSRGAAFGDVHAVTERVEEVLRGIFRNADVLVHAEPETPRGAEVLEAAHALAAEEGARVHDLLLHETASGADLVVHLEWAVDLAIAEAHRRASRVEDGLRDTHPELRRVTTHLECAGNLASGRRDATEEQPELIAAVRRAALAQKGVRGTREEVLLEGEGRFWLSMVCLLDPSLKLSEAHDVASAVESAATSLDGRIAAATVHAEPSE
jgi:cation diffusion facilitator family transporter